MIHQYSNEFRSTTELGFILEDMCPYPQSWEIFSYDDEYKVLEYGIFWYDDYTSYPKRRTHYVSQGKVSIDLANATVEQRNEALRKIFC